MNAPAVWNLGTALLNSPAWVVLLVKITVLLSLGWLGHALLTRRNPRYRLFWWRGVSVALVVLALAAVLMPALSVPLVSARASLDAGPVSTADTPPVSATEQPRRRAGSFDRTQRNRAVAARPVATGPSAPEPAAVPEPLRDTRSVVPAEVRGTESPQQAKTVLTAAPVSQTEAVASAGPEPARAAEGWDSGLAIGWVLFLVWAGGVLASTMKIVREAIVVRRFVRRSCDVPGALQTLCGTLVHALMPGRAIAVAGHKELATPVLFGVRRPTILLPAWMCDEEHCRDWPAVLAHEISHVRSRDLAWQMLLHAASILLWFHPLAWRMRRAHTAACELKADLDSAEFLGERESYIRTLARVALFAAAPLPRAGLAMARRSDVSRRLAFLKDAVFPGPLRRWTLTAAGSVGLLLAVALGGLQFAAAENAADPAAPKRDKSAKADTKPKDKPAATRKLTVRIVDERGNPVPGATLVVRINDDRKTHRPDAAGKIVLEIPRKPPALFLLTAQAPRRVRTQGRWYNREGRLPQPIPGEITFRLERGTLIGGKVVDKSGKPISGATVNVSASGRRATAKDPTSQSVYDFKAKTDASGRWRCDVAPKRLTRVSLQVEHPNYVSQPFHRSVRDKDFPKLRNFTHASILEKGFIVEGVVTWKGQPIKGAVLALGNSPFGASGRIPKPKTNQRGYYQFKNVPKGSTAITVIARGYAPELRRITVSEELDSVDFRLKKGQTLRIRVVDKQGKPIAGARAIPETWRGCRSLMGLYEGMIPVTADEQGRIAWNGAPDDEVLYDVYQRGYMSVRRRPLKARKDEYVITLLPELRISGRVIDAETKRPIPAFKVVHGIDWQNRASRTLTRYDTADGRDGKYATAFNLPYPRHFLRIEARGYRPVESRLIKNDEGTIHIDFSLDKAQGPQGIVLTKDGKPVPGARLYLYTPTDGIYVREGAAVDRNRTPETKTDKAGRFQFDPQTEEFGLFVVADEGYARVLQSELSAASGKITLQPWARVEGTLSLGGKLRANEGVSLNLNNDTTPGRPRAYFDYDTKTDAKGRFVFDKVPPDMTGHVARRIVIQRRGDGMTIGYSHSTPVEIAPGKTARVKLGGTGRPVTGRLVLPGVDTGKVDWKNSLRAVRKPMPRLPGMRRPFAPSYSFRVGPTGAFRVDDVPPGDYELIVAAYAQRMENRRRFDRGKLLGSLRKAIRIAPVPGGHSSKPLDLGELKLNKP